MVTSNGVGTVSIFLLPDLTDQVSHAGPDSIQGTVGDTDATATTGIPIQEASSNGLSIVRFVWQTGTAALAATSGPALGATQGGHSPSR